MLVLLAAGKLSCRTEDFRTPLENFDTHSTRFDSTEESK